MRYINYIMRYTVKINNYTKICTSKQLYCQNEQFNQFQLFKEITTLKNTAVGIKLSCEKIICFSLYSIYILKIDLLKKFSQHKYSC